MAGDQSASLDGQDDVTASFIKIQEHGGEKCQVIAGTLERLNPLPASSRKRCCIYKASDHIGKSNEWEAYTPQVISIGPFHRNNPKLETMERFKWSYLKSFKERADTQLEDIVNTIKGAEQSVRECYSERILLGSDDTAFPSRSKRGHPFIELCICQFEYYNVQEFVHHDPDRDSGSSGMFILHFTDLVRNFCMPPRERRLERSYQDMKEMRSAAQLGEVGLKFMMQGDPRQMMLSCQIAP